MSEVRLTREALDETAVVLPLPRRDPDRDSDPHPDPAVPVSVEPRTRRRPLEDQLPSWLLRAGLAFVLSYAATSSFVHPDTFARYFPSFLPEAWVGELLPVFAVFEMVLAVGLMTDRWAAAASTLAGLTMVAIIVVNPEVFNVLFRNVAIACAAFALAVQSRRDRDERRRPDA